MAALLLLTEIQQALPLPRLAQLTNTDLPNNPNTLAVAGTCLVTNGSTAVVGTGTTFTSLVVGNVIAFSSQPGVNYTIAAIPSATSLTLAPLTSGGVGYTGTTAAAATALTAGINYSNLQLACYYATVEFRARTNLPWDNTTVTDPTASPAVYNKCTWAGILLALAWLYRFSGSPLAEKAASDAKEACDIVLHTWGDGAWAPPVSDSTFDPLYIPWPHRPAFDSSRFDGIIPQGPNGGSRLSGIGASSPSDWTG